MSTLGKNGLASGEKRTEEGERNFDQSRCYGGISKESGQFRRTQKGPSANRMSFPAVFLATIATCKGIWGSAWSELAKMGKLWQLASFSVTNAWDWTYKFLHEFPLRSSFAAQSLLRMFQKILCQCSNRGLRCDSYTISFHFRTRNILATRPLVLFALTIWQIVGSLKLNGKEYCKPRG